MNIYDTANNLAKEIKDSEEYKKFKELKTSISSNNEKKSKIDEFEKLRYEMQLQTLQGKNQDTSKMTELQTKYTELISDEEIREYFNAEMKFNIMIADVNKIIGDAVKDVI